MVGSLWMEVIDMAWIIEYQSWECYDVETKEEAIAEFRKQYPNEEIVGMVN